MVTELCRKHGMSRAAYAWKAKFGGLEVSDAKRLRVPEGENAKLKRLLAKAMLDNAGLKDLRVKKMVAPAAKREAVAYLQATLGMSERRACCRRSGSQERPVSLVPGGRWRPAVAFARAGAAAAAVRLPTAAHPAPARRHHDQPQEDAAALSRGGADSASQEGAKARRWRAGACAYTGAPQPALEPGLRP